MKPPKLRLPPTLDARLTEILGAKPTTRRILELLKEREMADLDQSDKDAGREPFHPRVIAEQVSPDPGESMGLVEAAAVKRAAEGRARVQARIDEHRARGLDPNAPPEDAAAEATSDEVLPAPLDRGARDPDGPPEKPEVENEAEEIERLKQSGLARTREVAETLERKVLQRLPEIRAGGAGRLRSLEDAAEVLIAELQPGDIDAIRQVCAEHQLAPWVVCLGAIKRMADLQELHFGEFDEQWVNGQTGGRPASVKEQRCEVCQGLLPGDARRGQRFCCSAHGSEKVTHSEGCSLSHLQMTVQGRWVDTRMSGAPR